MSAASSCPGGGGRLRFLPAPTRGSVVTSRFVPNLLAYAVPTFALGYAWHLKLFARSYQALEIYRNDILIPFGFVAIVLQGTVVAWVYPRLAGSPGSFADAMLFAAGAALLSWTFTTLSVAAKHHMASVAAFVRIETAFTVVQFLLVGPLLALTSR